VSVRDDGALAVAAGSVGTVLVRDGSGAWRPAMVGTTANLHAALVEESTVYVAGDDGALFEAADPRDGWTPIDTKTRAALWSLEDL
jgi:hypothetical protein